MISTAGTSRNGRKRAASSESAKGRARGEVLTEFLVKHRWIIVVGAVLPLSKAYSAYWRLRYVYARNLRSSARRHPKRVQRIVRQIEAWRESGTPGLLYSSRRGWQSVTARAIDYKKQHGGVDLDLHDVLEVDLERRVVRVEPRVNMGQLTAKLAPLGVTVPVVAELDDLTVGGLIMGYGIESSSHKYGLFADTVRSAELVLGDGRVVNASPSEHADLFYALPWSYGAHGLLTAVELPLIEAKPYVRLSYRPVRGMDEAVRQFTELACDGKPPEFLECILFSKDRGVLLVGEFGDLPEGAEVNPIGRFYKPWFYRHAERCAREGGKTEYIPLRSYYHRYTRSLYWHGELLVPFGNHPLFRALLGWLMPPKVSLLRLFQTERIREYREARNVVQDALIPIRFLREGIELFHREFECYPLWLCAHKMFRTSPQGMTRPSDPGYDWEMFVDLGAWQMPGFVKRGEPFDGRQAVRRMERWLRAHHGYQCLYAVTEQTREQFWKMFDRTLYDQVRGKYGGGGTFMDVFDKIARPENR